MTIGAVHWVELPPSTGHEQSGHTAVIVPDDAHAGKLPVPLTTATSTLRFPGTVLVQPSDENGLQYPSVALVFQARAIDRSRIGDRVGIVSAGVLAEIFAALDKLMGRGFQSTMPLRSPPTRHFDRGDLREFNKVIDHEKPENAAQKHGTHRGRRPTQDDSTTSCFSLVGQGKPCLHGNRGGHHVSGLRQSVPGGQGHKSG